MLPESTVELKEWQVVASGSLLAVSEGLLRVPESTFEVQEWQVVASESLLAVSE